MTHHVLHARSAQPSSPLGNLAVVHDMPRCASLKCSEVYGSPIHGLGNPAPSMIPPSSMLSPSEVRLRPAGLALMTAM